MPVCSFFLRGICTHENCPYSHVNVNPKAAICPAFLKGYCPDGVACKLKHMFKKKEEEEDNKTTEVTIEVTTNKTTKVEGELSQDEFNLLRPHFT